MFEFSKQLGLLGVGVLSGFVDSIAGGGGLISLPALSVVVGIGPGAVGTNKIAAMVGAFTALWVYARKGHLDLKKSMLFASCTGFGAFLGSLWAPLLPKESFRWILWVTCPLILWVVWNKDLWVHRGVQQGVHSRKQVLAIVGSGIVCGLYDGLWGPGAGTFMLLALLFYAKLPLFVALATSKLANSSSAVLALVSYSVQGYVHWMEGIVTAVGISGGAFVGAHLASKGATRVVRPVLVVVMVLLLLKLVI